MVRAFRQGRTGPRQWARVAGMPVMGSVLAAGADGPGMREIACRMIAACSAGVRL
jgi:hypothetical protein